MSGINYTDSATGLRIVDEPYPNGVRARAVYKGDKCLYHGEAVGVRYFVTGYAMANAEPIPDLMHDPRISDEAIKAAAEALRIEAGQSKPATCCAFCDKPSDELIDNQWMYGAACGECAEDALETIEQELTALRSRQEAAS